MIDAVFLAHPRSVGESYAEHALVAMRFGGAMILAGLALFVHALLPVLFVRTGSSTIKQLYAEIKNRQPLLGHEAPSFRSEAWALEYEI
jgi:hypothetical protein